MLLISLGYAGYAGQPVTSFVMLSLRLLLVVVAVVVAAAQCAARGKRQAAGQPVTSLVLLSTRLLAVVVVVSSPLLLSLLSSFIVAYSGR